MDGRIETFDERDTLAVGGGTSRMTKEDLDKRIKRLEDEGQILLQSHQATTRRAQEIISQNLTRLAQIQGAIAELQNLKENINDNTNGSTEPALATDRLSDPCGRDSRNRGVNVDDRKVHKSHTPTC